MALQLFKIASTTVATPASSIDFTSIPAGYTDLKLVISSRDTNANSTNAFANIALTFNGDASSIYAWRLIYGLGTSLGNVSSSTASGIGVIYHPSSSATSGTFANTEVYIPNYTSSNYKSLSSDGQTETNATAGFNYFTAALWPSASAITSIKLTAMTNFDANSTATLYGVL